MKKSKSLSRVVQAPAIRIKAYPVVMEAVERGAEYGLNRAFKHNDSPDAQIIKDAIATAIQNELCEIMDFAPFEDEDRP
jgi:hypothetical protein